MPKIADFGLSRLFSDTLTRHTTKKYIGTVGYMPPEYIQICHITEKFDVFSLGVIIIEIMTGTKETSKRADMSPQQFIELVHENWRRRFEQATPMYTSEEVESLRLQMKTCIEMALQCVEAQRLKRPTIAEVVSRLNILDDMVRKISPSLLLYKPPIDPLSSGDQSASTSKYSAATTLEARYKLKPKKEEKRGGGNDQEAVLAKIGPWGGNAGKAHNIKVASHRLLSVTVWFADIVDALAFSYVDLKGKTKHQAGPWGGPGGSARTVQFGPSEFLTEISGTTGPYVCAVADVVKSLTLVTNSGSYGPFGQGGGTAFHTSQSNGSIVGFFGRAGGFLHSIGVYVSPNRPTLDLSRHFRDALQVNSEHETIQEERGKGDDDALTKFGPWGGSGDMDRDMEVVPHRLESLTICSADIINSLAFSYNDHNGKQHTVGPWGGDGGAAFTIRLGAFEHIKGLSGTVGSFGMLQNVITSLKFTTNLNRTYGPYGKGGGTPFVVPVEDAASIVGFFGRAGPCVEAVGVYIRTYL
ncbi:hypothetical protein DAI22_11g193900 [Oryza sativa Japonica Group]|nr:hypothetical protein DAI22_11g193900 [Oryza sativa Japonica Group]